MAKRSKIRTSLLVGMLAATTAGVAAETIEISTAPIVSGYYYVPPDGRYYLVPATTEHYITPVTTTVQPRITVYADRASEDQLITRDVVDEIGQAERAARHARRVDGVRNVSNNVRARVGG